MMDELFKRMALFLFFTLMIGGRIWHFPRGFRNAIEEVRITEERNKQVDSRGFRVRHPRRE